MIIPSIDLMDGQAVQLIGGEHKAIEAGDPFPIAERFALAGELAVIDLDAALGRGDNASLIRELIQRYPCRIGGGIRDRECAVRLLDAGAASVIFGTAAEPALLSSLPRDRVVAALDSRHGEVVVDGWRRGTGRDLIDRIRELREVVGSFLVTFVEREGRMAGTAMDRVSPVIEAAGDVRVTVAGGVTTPAEIAAIDAAGADVQVGMALYSGALDLADGITAPLTSDRPDGLWATVVADDSGRALGLAWSDAESVREAVARRMGVYRSRSRGLWVKGETSDSTQQLLRIDIDCDRDALRFTVRQSGSGFCHRGTRSCWGEERGLDRLQRILRRRRAVAPANSYTRRLLDDADLLRAKLVEEAAELAEAPPEQVALEAADLLYFALVAMARSGVALADVERVLDLRGRKLTRRRGNAKPVPEERP